MIHTEGWNLSLLWMQHVTLVTIATSEQELWLFLFFGSPFFPPVEFSFTLCQVYLAMLAGYSRSFGSPVHFPATLPPPSHSPGGCAGGTRRAQRLGFRQLLAGLLCRAHTAAPRRTCLGALGPWGVSQSLPEFLDFQLLGKTSLVG